MRYEAGNCTIVVSIKELPNDVLEMIFNLSQCFVENQSDHRLCVLIGSLTVLISDH